MRYLLALLLITIPASATALDLSARLTSSLYSWERQDTDTTSIAQNTIHQVISLQAKNLGIKGLSFHAYGRGFYHAEGSESHRRLALYSTYADWKGIARRLDLRLGRQRVFAGVGRGTFDGGRAVVRLPHSISLLAYAGIEAPPDRSTDLRDWDEANMYGFRASVRRWKTTMSVSFASESRERSESTLNDPTGEPVELPSLARRLLGAEVRSTYLTGADLYGRVDVDAIEWEAARVQVRARKKISPKLRMSGELDHRRPVLDSNSYLSVFRSESNTELEATMAYSMRRGLELTSSYAVVYFDDDTTQRFRLGLSRGYSSISYYRRIGYGGDRDGLSLGSRREITPQISLRGNLNFSTYKLSDVQDDRDDTLAGVLGLDYTNAGRFAAAIEGQMLRNRTYDYDFRLFARVTWWFSIKR